MGGWGRWGNWFCSRQRNNKVFETLTWEHVQHVWGAARKQSRAKEEWRRLKGDDKITQKSDDSSSQSCGSSGGWWEIGIAAKVMKERGISIFDLLNGRIELPLTEVRDYCRRSGVWEKRLELYFCHIWDTYLSSKWRGQTGSWISILWHLGNKLGRRNKYEQVCAMLLNTAKN